MKSMPTIAALQLVAILLGAGCLPEEVSEPVEPRVPKVTVCGVDRTGSYDFPAIGLRHCAMVIDRSEAGDIVLVRWVSGASYGPAEFAMRIEIPTIEVPECSNPWNRACHERRAAAEAAIVKAKGEKIRELLALEPQVAMNTDVSGFFASAADTFASTSADAERYIEVATDLVDNVRLRAEPNLENVRVSIVALQTGTDPTETRTLIDSWDERLRGWGAADVSFKIVEVAQ